MGQRRRRSPLIHRRGGGDPWRLLSGWTASGGEPAHDGVERRLPLESDAGPFRQREIAAVQLGVIGKAAEGAEYAGIGFRAAEPETSGNGERHLIAAVRKQCAARPAVALEHCDGAGVLHDAIGLWRVGPGVVVSPRTPPPAHPPGFLPLPPKPTFSRLPPP